MNEIQNLEKLPKGMEVTIPEETKNNIDNVKLKEINYIKLLHDKIKEIKEIDFDIKNVEITENEEGTKVLLLIDLKKGVV